MVKKSTGGAPELGQFRTVMVDLFVESCLRLRRRHTHTTPQDFAVRITAIGVHGGEVGFRLARSPQPGRKGNALAMKTLRRRTPWRTLPRGLPRESFSIEMP
jgi:hypothetical protein